MKLRGTLQKAISVEPPVRTLISSLSLNECVCRRGSALAERDTGWHHSRSISQRMLHSHSKYLVATHAVPCKVNNPLAHELTTAPEIIAAVTSTPSTHAYPSSGKVDVFVGGAGTGGTISGVARGIKKSHNKDCVVVGVDPVRSRLVPFPPSLLSCAHAGWFPSRRPRFSQ